MDQIEELSPVEADFSKIIAELNHHIAAFQNLINKKQRQLRYSPEGRLRAAKSHNSAQYFQVMGKGTGNKNGIYIPKNNFKLAEQLAQKEYNAALVKSLKYHVKVLTRATRHLKNKIPVPAAVHKKMPTLKRNLICPVSLPNSDYVLRWKNHPYQKGPFADGTQYFTALGEQVRSKSEILIADTLTRLGIPYRYEFPLQVTVGPGIHKEFHPDFLCLNLRTRQEFIWEHFGLMDNAEYAANCVEKICIYERNGIIPGDRLIFTMETAVLPLNTKSVERLAKRWLV